MLFFNIFMLFFQKNFNRKNLFDIIQGRVYKGGCARMKTLKLPSLSQKLFLTFILSFLIPLSLIGIFIAYLFGNYQYQDLRSQSVNDTRLIHAYLTNYINDIDNIMKGPYYSPYLQSQSDLSQMSIFDKNQVSEEIGDALRLAAYSREDFGDLLFISDQEVLYFNVENYYQYLPTLQSLESRNWYVDAIEKNGKTAITPYQDGGTDSFFVSRQLKNLYDPEQENVIVVNINTRFLDALFSEIDTRTPGIVLFTNDKGELIYSSSAVNASFTAHLGENQFRYERRMWIHESQSLEDYPLTVHVLLSASYTTQQITIFILICLFCFLTAICIAYLLFHGNNRWIQIPIYQIQSVLKEMEKGHLDARCTELPIQEFQDIGFSVNHMAEKLQEKIHNEYELLIAQKNLQFQALQSQIRPHFIINTIYSFITLNQIGETELLNDCFYRFAAILRYVLSKDQETTLKKELDFLDSYCSLFHLRFGERIQYTISCEESLESLCMPKLLLQPLVENAVIHGIEPSETPCTLNITVEKHGEKIYIIIEDSGVGFTKEQLHSPSSIGLKNVENRMNLWNKDIKFYLYRVNGLTIQAVIIPGFLKGEKK